MTMQFSYEISQSVREKVLTFEKIILEKRKKDIIENLIIKTQSRKNQIFFLINSVLSGISFANIISNFKENTIHWFGTPLFIMVGLYSSIYVYEYFLKYRNKKTIITNINKLDTLIKLDNYIGSLSNWYFRLELLMRVKKINYTLYLHKKIDNDDMKILINSLNQEEVIFILEFLNKHSVKDGFSSQFIKDITNKCNADEFKNIKEETFKNNLKTITFPINDTHNEYNNYSNLMSTFKDKKNQEELLKAILEHSNENLSTANKQTEIKKEKLNFKKNL